MKYFIFIFLFFHGMSSIGQVTDIVIIRHIGESDKPIPSIIIYTKGVCNNPCPQLVLALYKTDSFLKVISTDTNLINVFCHDSQDIKPTLKQEIYMFGSLEITCYQSRDCRKKVLIINDRKMSLIFIDTIIKKITKENNLKNNELIAVLENLKKRIAF